MRSTTAEASSLRTHMLREHLELEQTFAALLAAVDGDDRVQSAKLWSKFDARLQAHMQLEEDLILSAFEREHPREAVSIRREHVEIRRVLLELGVGVDLHLIRAEVVERFIALLRAHAAGEDLQFYLWLQEHLAEDVQMDLVERSRSGIYGASGVR